MCSNESYCKDSEENHRMPFCILLRLYSILIFPGGGEEKLAELGHRSWNFSRDSIRCLWSTNCLSLLFFWVIKKWTQFCVQNIITLDEAWSVHKQNISLSIVPEIQQHGSYAHCLYVVWRTSLDVTSNQLHCKWLDTIRTTFVTRATWMRENKELTVRCFQALSYPY